MNEDRKPLRLMGPAAIHFDLNLIWHFTRNGTTASNDLVFFAGTRAWASQVKVKSGQFGVVNDYKFWPAVTPEDLLALLPDEEKAKAVAASLGIRLQD